MANFLIIKHLNILRGKNSISSLLNKFCAFFPCCCSSTQVGNIYLSSFCTLSLARSLSRALISALFSSTYCFFFFFVFRYTFASIKIGKLSFSHSSMARRIMQNGHYTLTFSCKLHSSQRCIINCYYRVLFVQAQSFHFSNLIRFDKSKEKTIVSQISFKFMQLCAVCPYIWFAMPLKLDFHCFFIVLSSFSFQFTMLFWRTFCRSDFPTIIYSYRSFQPEFLFNPPPGEFRTGFHFEYLHFSRFHSSDVGQCTNVF